MVSLKATNHSGPRTGGGTVRSRSPRARQAAAQIAPLARNVQVTTRQGVRSARVWAAPRLERTGRAVQEQAAPRVSAMLSSAARRVEPAPPRGRRRWPVLVAGMAVAAGGAVAALLLGRRGSGADTNPGQRETAGEEPPEHEATAGTSGAPGGDQHAHTP